LFALPLIRSVWPAWTTAVVWDTETVIAEKVMVADPDFEPSATDVALTVIVTSLAGGVVGAK
jgi:hypothetical protein